MTSADVQIRIATPDDLPAIAVADGRAFGTHYDDQDLLDAELTVDLSRFLLACEPDGRIAGVTGDFPFAMTLPGGAEIEVPGVTWVSVATTHRRRGILRALLTAQHRGYLDAGYVASTLTASEGGIYGRFGYGQATPLRQLDVDRSRARFRADAPDPGGVWQAESDEARRHAPAVYERWRRATPGALSRSDAWWDMLLLDRPSGRGGRSALFFLLHPDGYASYRTDRADRRVVVEELFAATPEAHVALWRVLLGLDLVDTVQAVTTADDPLPWLFADHRQVRVQREFDGMWVRPLDVAALLAARRYAVELDVVLDVADGFLDRGGRFRLRGGPDGASCERTDRAPDVRLDVAALGALSLGGHPVSSLARAARVAGAPEVVHRLDAALLTDRAPNHGTDF